MTRPDDAIAATANRPNSNRELWLAFGTAVFFLSTWFAGMPLPNVDDLFFLGPALELLRDGSLANPLIAKWHPAAATSFLIQPPIYPRIMSLWLEASGVSADAVRAFHCACLAGASLAANAALQRLGYRATLVVPVAMALSLTSSGLRHDNLGLLFAACGLLLLTAQRVPMQAAGSFLLFCAAATWPILIAFSAPAIATRLWSSPRRAAFALQTIVAAAVAAAMVLILIDFQLSRFASEFLGLGHLANARSGMGAAIAHQLTVGWSEFERLPQLLVLACLGSMAWGRRAAGQRPVVLSAIASLALVTALYPFAFVAFFMLLSLPLIAIWSRALLKPWFAAVAVAAALMPRLFLPMMEVAAHMSPREQRQVAPGTLAHQQLFVDEYAARAIYSYRLPKGVLDWNWSRSPPGPSWPTDAAMMSQGDLWVISSGKSAKCGGISPRQPFRLLGWSFNSIPASPWALVLVNGTSTVVDPEVRR